MPKVLIVEDDKSLLDAILERLSLTTLSVESTGNGEDALQLALCFPYDVIVLDWNLPGMEGVEVLRRYRQSGGKAAILMLTGRSQLVEKRTGFEVGADDYLTKPFEMEEMIMRIYALLRRIGRFQGDLLRAGSLTVDTQTCMVTANGKTIKLRPREYAVLEFLLRHANETFKSEQLLKHVWPSSSESSPEAVRVCMHEMRTKLYEHEGVPKVTYVPGAGYRLELAANE